MPSPLPQWDKPKRPSSNSPPFFLVYIPGDFGPILTTNHQQCNMESNNLNALDFTQIILLQNILRASETIDAEPDIL